MTAALKMTLECQQRVMLSIASTSEKIIDIARDGYTPTQRSVTAHLTQWDSLQEDLGMIRKTLDAEFRKLSSSKIIDDYNHILADIENERKTIGKLIIALGKIAPETADAINGTLILVKRSAEHAVLRINNVLRSKSEF